MTHSLRFAERTVPLPRLISPDFLATIVGNLSAEDETYVSLWTPPWSPGSALGSFFFVEQGG
jgi:hypothetical protein